MTDKDIAIRVADLSKCYRIGLKEEVSDSVSSAIFAFLKSPLRNYRRYRSLYTFDDIREGADAASVIWALRGVSFEVRRGEALGVIGRNGSGKSTLLKVLSRVTDPTGGEVRIRGRVSSLLEVGTGFHPELTGRENVYLNGTILGMKKKEVDSKFEEIVDFSGIEKFIDTPVKRYSSGMKVRLAFSVAAHLDPEILIIDEVLAVGDAEFQRKCLEKMGDVAEKGRTVVFVSHDMGAVNRLCEKGIWIDEGRVREKGEISEIIGHYLSHSSSLNGEVDLKNIITIKRQGPVFVQRACTKSSEGEIKTQFKMGEDLVFEFDIFSNQTVRKISLALYIKTITGIRVLHLSGKRSGFLVDELIGTKKIMVTIPRIPLYPGSYTFSVWAGDTVGNKYDYIKDFMSVEIIDPGSYGSGSSLTWRYGLLAYPSDWREMVLDKKMSNDIEFVKSHPC